MLEAAGHRTGDNPVEGCSRVSRSRAIAMATIRRCPRPKCRPSTALRVSGRSEGARLAFEFLSLTATRTSEVLGATWAEIDLARALWTLLARRMKAGREHRVPLAPRCIEILTRAEPPVIVGAGQGPHARSSCRA